ncbi:acyl-CoA dehydrogenase family protein [Microbacterium invictum]|uniref:Acyl-CoA dehydrogenase family protein n=1 Tax=Microbacterium invictum TaxID=515415 RepID=A0ABZ0VD12_9MICO|nr:acyl-CoA dehydrogenase family protein [Microbacterium invictum]WQB71124.1 acyl-CoA dehydrogenase family protein [Microbacterium invictum]
MSAVDARTIPGARAQEEPRDDRFAAFLDRVAVGAVDRERDRRLLFDEVAELRGLGFGALRVPAAHGGEDRAFAEVIDRVIRLSAADASLGHLWRGHIAFVEDLRAQGGGADDRWWRRILDGDLIGNAQSERQSTARLETRIDRDGDELLLTGTKYYTTGSIYADWIHLAALDGGERVAVTVAAAHPGVRPVDDWDGFGQLLTGSGTTTFERVPVDPRDVVPSIEDERRWAALGSVFQLTLLAVIAGIAQRALDDTVAFVRPRRRTFGFAGETLPADDPLVQLVVGEVSAAAAASRRLVLSVAVELGDALEDRGAGSAERLRALQLEVYRLQEVVPRLILDAATRLFEVGGASAVSVSTALDRHWRNVRTIASHNPVVQRTRAIGQWELRGTLPAWKAPGA